MLFLDSAVIDEVREAAALPFVGGVSCNPSLLASATGQKEISSQQFISHLRNLAAAHPGTLFVQTLATSEDEMVREAHLIRSVVPVHRVIVKMPPSMEGLRATARLRRQRVATCTTAIFTPLQAYLAACSGADWIAPYCNRITAAGGDGVRTTGDMLTMLRQHAPACRLLVASVKTTDEMQALLMLGCHHVTVPLSLLREVQTHPLAETALQRFADDLSLV